jgi:hypothetical protein
MPLVSAEGRNFHLPPGLSRRRPSRLYSEEARFSYLRLGGCGYGTSHEGHAISYKLRYYSSFSRFHHEGIITTNTPDRRATTLLYDVNSPTSYIRRRGEDAICAQKDAATSSVD